MGRLRDLTGMKYGRLTVIERAGSSVSPGGVSRATWLCRCDCGITTVVTSCNLMSGHTQSCGCYSFECRKSFGSGSSTHGGSNTRLYHIWVSMRQRCANPKDRSYKDYGGRGIAVCSDWANDFSKFRAWAESHGYGGSLSIDRIDVDGNYCPENCRWIDMALQSQNRRTSRPITYNGQNLKVDEFATAIGVHPSSVRRWRKKGMTAEEMAEYAKTI